MANVKVTSLTELSTEQLDQFTWFLASHRTDDEQSSNKVNFASISTHLCADLSIYEMQDAIKDATGATGGQSERITELRRDLNALSAGIPITYATKLTTDSISNDIATVSANVKALDVSQFAGRISELETFSRSLSTVVKPADESTAASLDKLVLKYSSGKLYTKDGTLIDVGDNGGTPPDYDMIRTQVLQNKTDIGSLQTSMTTVNSEIAALKLSAVTFTTETVDSTGISIPAGGFATATVDFTNSSQYQYVNSLSVSNSSAMIIGQYCNRSRQACIILYNGTGAAITTNLKTELVHIN